MGMIDPLHIGTVDRQQCLSTMKQVQGPLSRITYTYSKTCFSDPPSWCSRCSSEVSDIRLGHYVASDCALLAIGRLIDGNSIKIFGNIFIDT